MMRQTLLRTHKRALSTTTVRAQSVAARPALSAPSAAAPFEAPVRGLATEAEEEATPGGMGARFAYTAEVTVSKLFPAGFGWQYSSCLAGAAGLGDTDLSFFVTTGVGDMVAVTAGHTGYYAVKSMFDKSLKFSEFATGGIWLGSAAFCSGGGWQPIVNGCHAMNMGFTSSCITVTVLCGSLFYTGLRVGRMFYGGLLGLPLPSADYANLKADAQLSVSIGGAAACFVGTDVSYDDNWLRGLVGVEDGVTDLGGSITAGSSTALGFVVFQTAQNLAVPAGRCWVD